MWPRSFSERLSNWAELRNRCQNLSRETALLHINEWWLSTPWTAYHLHWDDRASWPDPWQLLEDNVYCNLARGLGIMYTIAIIDRPDIQHTVLAECGSDNLVLVDQGKYILNWDQDTIVNISHDPPRIRHQLDQQQIKLQIR